MTGPAYPPPPGAGSNGIGTFVIGVSALGDIPAFDVWETVISQYANSPIITTILTDFADNIDQTQNLAEFYDFVMNVETAFGYGLDVLGRLVAIGRILNVPTNGAAFGFEEGLPSWTGFNQAPFGSGSSSNQAYVLEDAAYRKLILAKALFNICDGSIPAINQILINLFCTPWRGNAYVAEGAGRGTFFGFAESTTATGFNQDPFYDGSVSFEIMTMTYTFEFPLTPVEDAIVRYSNVLPKPTGVKVLIAQI